VFSKYISSLSLTGEVADSVFTNIIDYGSSVDCGFDTSFLATLRCLLYNRIPENDVVILKVRNRAIPSSRFSTYTDKEIFHDIARYALDGNCLCVVSFTNQTSKKCMEFIEKNFLAHTSGYREIKELHVFMASAVKSSTGSINVRFFINKETKSTVIFGEKISSKTWHLIQSLTSKLLPWYFEESPLTEEEKELVRSLTKHDPPVKEDGSQPLTTYEMLIEKMSAKFDLRKHLIQNVLTGFEVSAKKEQLRMILAEIDRLHRDIELNSRKYLELITFLDEKNTTKDGLQYQIDNNESDSELLEYFMCNKHLHPIRTSGSTLEFIVKCFLDGFDPDMFESFAKNPDSYLYSAYDDQEDVWYDMNNRKLLLNAIFSDTPVLKVKMCAVYILDLRGEISTIRHYAYPHNEFVNCIPNPHLDTHACFGNYKRYIQEAIRKGDNIHAIEQCICSAGSINIGESATFPKFLAKIFSRYCKSVIELPDGTEVTPVEALNWLKNKENSNQEE